MAHKKYTAEDCFMVWVNLGSDRSIDRVADITGKSPKTIYNYSSSGNWKERLANLNEQNKSTIEAIVADNQNGVKLLESEIYAGVSDKLLSIIRDSMELLEPTGNPRELKTLVDTYRLINGQPTDISRQEVSTINPDALTEDELETLAEDVIDRLFGESAEA